MPRGGFLRGLAKAAERGIAEVKQQVKEQGLQQIQSVASSTGVSGIVPTGAIQQVAQQVQSVASSTGITTVVQQGVSTVQSVEQQAAQQVQTIATTTGVTTVVQQGVSTVQSAEQQAQQQIQTVANNTGLSNVVSQVQSAGQQAQQQIQSAEQQAQQQIQSMTANNGSSPGDSSGQDAQNQSDNSNNNQDLSRDLHDISKLGRVVYNSVGKNDQKPQQSSTISVAEVEPSSPASITLDGCSGQIAITQGYCTTSVPAMNVCPSCYQKYISASWFAFSFRRVEYLPGSRNTCDMAVKAVRDIWGTVSAIAAQQQGALLQQLTQQVGQITQQPTGNARLVEAGPVNMNMNIARKQVQAKQPVTQVVELISGVNGLVNLVNGQ